MSQFETLSAFRRKFGVRQVGEDADDKGKQGAGVKPYPSMSNPWVSTLTKARVKSASAA